MVDVHVSFPELELLKRETGVFEGSLDPKLSQ
jgi:hypothetical protein